MYAVFSEQFDNFAGHSAVTIYGADATKRIVEFIHAVNMIVN